MKNKATLAGGANFSGLALLAGLLTATTNCHAQEARFFRMAGPVPANLTTFRPDGTIVWTHAPTNATFTVQMATILGAGNNWTDFVQIPSTSETNTSQLLDFHPPVGMAFIPAGSFIMGDTFSEGWANELPLHPVYVSAFYMDRFPVTKNVWDGVYNWATNHGYAFSNQGSGKAAAHPVQTVSWYDSVKWCNARSEMAGKIPAYYTEAAQTSVYRSGQINIRNDWVNWTNGYRLPTEAEWEKAARGGPSGQRFPWGNTTSWSQANYYANPADYNYDANPTSGFDPAFNDGTYPYTSPVGYFAPNGYGLSDMAGNVWHWTWDCDGYYTSAMQSDPRGPTSDLYGGFNRMIRGGSWWYYALRGRTAFRSNYSPADSCNYVGFRTVYAADPAR